jgi:hypothetical protein
VDPVVEGMTRAKQDRLSPPTDGTPRALAEATFGFPCMSVLVHGDAAFAGQGVVAETLNLSGLSGYRTGGTVHVVINNQLGFTTAPASARTSVYPTDVAKMVQAPIFHVNGDDPEACVRAARLAFSFRQTFHKDVVIDLVCYRKHGHNEGDDPSYTQPLMYQRIDAKRSVRKLYTETLVRRGDITLEEAESALDDFNNRAAVRARRGAGRALAGPDRIFPSPTRRRRTSRPRRPGVGPGVLRALASVVRTVPDGFTIHPKLERQFAQRDEMVAKGQVDWALAEALAIGSLLYEGVNVRLTGQDTRRGTFSQRHAVLVDYTNGDELIPWPHRRRDGRVDTAPGATPRAARRLHRARLASLRVRRRRFRVRLFGRGARGPGGVGGAVRRLRQRCPDHHRQLPGGGRNQVGPARRPGHAAPARLRGAGPRALVVALRALPRALCAGQPAGGHPVDVGPVLPPPALAGEGHPEAAACRGDPQIDAAGPRLALADRRARSGLLRSIVLDDPR